MAWITKPSGTMEIERRDTPYLTDEIKNHAGEFEQDFDGMGSVMNSNDHEQDLADTFRYRFRRTLLPFVLPVFMVIAIYQLVNLMNASSSAFWNTLVGSIGTVSGLLICICVIRNDYRLTKIDEE